MANKQIIPFPKATENQSPIGALGHDYRCLTAFWLKMFTCQGSVEVRLEARRPLTDHAPSFLASPLIRVTLRVHHGQLTSHFDIDGIDHCIEPETLMLHAPIGQKDTLGNNHDHNAVFMHAPDYEIRGRRNLPTIPEPAIGLQ